MNFFRQNIKIPFLPLPSLSILSSNFKMKYFSQWETSIESEQRVLSQSESSMGEERRECANTRTQTNTLKRRYLEKFQSNWGRGGEKKGLRKGEGRLKRAILNPPSSFICWWMLTGKRNKDQFTQRTASERSGFHIHLSPATTAAQASLKCASDSATSRAKELCVKGYLEWTEHQIILQMCWLT